MKTKGRIKYNGKVVLYELRGRQGYSKSLYMKRGKGAWKHQGSVHPTISYVALQSYARQFLQK